MATDSSGFDLPSLGGAANPLGNIGAAAPNWFGLSTGNINNALPIISGIAGAFPQSGTTNQNGTQNTTQSSNTNSTLATLQSLFGTSNTNSNTNNNSQGTGNSNTNTTTGYGDAGNSVIAQSNPILSNLLSNSTNLAQSYLPQQVAAINGTSNAATANLNNSLAARGLSTSPVGVTAGQNIEASRQGQITNLQQQIPILQQQLQSQALNSASGYLSNLPKTSTSGTTQQQAQSSAGTAGQTGTTSQTGNTNQTGQQNSSGTSDTTSQSTSATKTGGGIGGFFGGLGAALASLFH